ncbi:MAG: hypothetical protein LBQ57_06745 [Spirochaetales bacterium]|jgi:hypothetical protein|nr:hypothetical protein [Spirochaetales bacterium]
MKKKSMYSAMLVCLMALVFVLAGCSDSDDGGGSNRPGWAGSGTFEYDPESGAYDDFISGDNGDSSGGYLLLWGSFNATKQAVKNKINDEGWGVTYVNTNTADESAYATGQLAVTILEYCVNGLAFDDSGIYFGTYADLLNYTSGGVGLTYGLKSAIAGQSANAPIAGVFGNPKGGAVVFFVARK